MVLLDDVPSFHYSNSTVIPIINKYVTILFKNVPFRIDNFSGPRPPASVLSVILWMVIQTFNVNRI